MYVNAPKLIISSVAKFNETYYYNSMSELLTAFFFRDTYSGPILFIVINTSATRLASWVSRFGIFRALNNCFINITTLYRACWLAFVKNFVGSAFYI